MAEPKAMTPDTSSTTTLTQDAVDANHKIEKNGRFWLIFVSLMISTFVAALELTAVTTALPIIAFELKGGEFSWVGAAYSLASTAFLPMTGGLAEVFRLFSNVVFTDDILRSMEDVRRYCLLCLCLCLEVLYAGALDQWDGLLVLEVSITSFIKMFLIRLSCPGSRRRGHILLDFHNSVRSCIFERKRSL